MNKTDVKFIIKRKDPPIVNEFNHIKTSSKRKSKVPIRVQRPKTISSKELLDKKLDQYPHNSKKQYNTDEKVAITTIKNLKVACILDDRVHEWFKYEFDLLPIGPYDWQKILTKQKPHFLFVQSAWRGNNDKWIYKIGCLNPTKNTPLKKLIKWCKNNKIPTVFWNKDDPYHFERFIEAAKLFDYIFTSDVNSIGRYKKLTGHNNVFTLPFAAQPKLHNPINKDKEKIGRLAFAGSWYNEGHATRKKDMKIILEPALKYDVDIYDRWYKLNNNNFKFPAIYQPNIRGDLSYKEMINTYKKYDVFLNVNTIQRSPSMFSCRVMELLGCGVPIISGYALGIEKFFPKIIKMSTSQVETEKYLNLLLDNKEHRDKLSLQGIREIYSKHTYKHRAKLILDKIGVKYKKYKESGVSIITCTMREDYINNVFDNYNNQSYHNKELIVVLNKNDMNFKIWKEKALVYPKVRVFKVDESKSLGECLNFAVGKSKYDYISRFDDDDYYGPNFTTDLMNAFDYSDADIVGKNSYYVYFEDSKTLAVRFPNKENSYTNFLIGGAMIINKNVFKMVEFSNENVGEDSQFLKNCIENSFKLYSADRYNYVYIRRSDPNSHSWSVNSDTLLQNTEIIDCKNNYKEYVTI